MEKNFKGIWISKDIWLIKELSITEKVFLVEINSLDNNAGCFASNSYFSDFFNLTNGRCSQIIKALEAKKFIKIRYEYEGKEVKKRVVNILKGGIKFSKGGIKNIKGGYLENAQDINTITINTINKKDQPKNKNFSEAKFSDLIESAYSHILILFKGENTIPKNKSQIETWKKTLSFFDKNGYDLREVYLAVQWARNDAFWKSNVLSLPALKTPKNGLRKIDSILAKFKAIKKEIEKPSSMAKIKKAAEWKIITAGDGSTEILCVLQNGETINQFIMRQNLGFTNEDISEIFNYIKNK